MGYTNCIFSDKSERTVNDLNTRLKESEGVLAKKYTAKTMDFERSIKNILELRKFGVAMLILIDPAGYKGIKWDQIVKLYEKVGIDVIFNFYTSSIARNAPPENRKNGKTLTEFFGDEKWKKITNESKSSLGKKLLKYYVEKIKESSGKYVIKIPVYKYKKDVLYHLLIITRSSGFKSVIEYSKKVMSGDITRIIKHELNVEDEDDTKQTKMSDY